MDVAPARWLVDKSALARLHHPAVASALRFRISSGIVSTCDVTDLEVLYSARNLVDYERTVAAHAAVYSHEPVVDVDWARARHVHHQLCAEGHHRGPGIADLLISAVAERAGLVVLHYDGDYDLVAEVTGQPTEWVAPRGSVP